MKKNINDIRASRKNDQPQDKPKDDSLNASELLRKEITPKITRDSNENNPTDEFDKINKINRHLRLTENHSLSLKFFVLNGIC